MAKKRCKKHSRRLKRKMRKLRGEKNRPRKKKRLVDPVEALRLYKQFTRNTTYSS